LPSTRVIAAMSVSVSLLANTCCTMRR
jgi:hypothetical protein